MNLMIKMMNLIKGIPYMTLMTDISALDNHQCHWSIVTHNVSLKVEEMLKYQLAEPTRS